MLQLEFKGRVFRIGEGDLKKILVDAVKELKDQEKRQGAISQFGMFGIADNLQVAGCFACGSFEDYTGRCKYDSEVKIRVNRDEKSLCKRSDMPAVYAIKSNKMAQYEVTKEV